MMSPGRYGVAWLAIASLACTAATTCPPRTATGRERLVQIRVGTRTWTAELASDVQLATSRDAVPADAYLISVDDWPSWPWMPRALAEWIAWGRIDGERLLHSSAIANRLEAVRQIVDDTERRVVWGSVLVREGSGSVVCTFRGPAARPWLDALRACQSLRDQPVAPTPVIDDPLAISFDVAGAPWSMSVPHGDHHLLGDGETHVIMTPAFAVTVVGSPMAAQAPPTLATFERPDEQVLFRRDLGVEGFELVSWAHDRVTGLVVVRADTTALCSFSVHQDDDWRAPLAACRSLHAGRP